MDVDDGARTDDPYAAVAVDCATTELPIGLSDFFQLLADEGTRYLLYALTDRGGTVLLEELEDWFDGDHVRTRLHHVHLPRLVDFHLVDYDPETGAITPSPLADDLRPALDVIRSLEADAALEFVERADQRRG